MARSIKTDAFTVTSEEGCLEFWFFTLEIAIDFYKEMFKREKDLKINKSVVNYNPDDWNDFDIISTGIELKLKN